MCACVCARVYCLENRHKSGYTVTSLIYKEKYRNQKVTVTDIFGYSVVFDHNRTGKTGGEWVVTLGFSERPSSTGYSQLEKAYGAIAL